MLLQMCRKSWSGVSSSIKKLFFTAKKDPEKLSILQSNYVYNGPRLTVELVPAPCWNLNLRHALVQSEWDLLRREVYKKAGYKCEICGGKGSSWPVECHEIWDYDDVKKIQSLKGLIALCPACHSVKHAGFASQQGKDEQVCQQLMRVNNWTMMETENYLDECLSIWNFRNLFRWDTDLSWLSTKKLAIPENKKTCSMGNRLEPLKLNYIGSSETYMTGSKALQPEDFWPNLIQFCKRDFPVALELILSIRDEICENPQDALEVVRRFVEKELVVDDLYVQINILLPNPFDDRIEEKRKSLGFQYAHVLISLQVMTGKKQFSIPSKESMSLVQSYCWDSYPNAPGKYQVHNGLLARWLTKEQLSFVWKYNAGLVPDVFFETPSSKQSVRMAIKTYIP